MRLSGPVLRTEQQTGTSPDGKPYAYTRVHVLDGIEVRACRLSDRWPVATPGEGEVIDAEVAVSTYKDKNGAPRLSVALLAPVASDARPSRAA